LAVEAPIGQLGGPTNTYNIQNVVNNSMNIHNSDTRLYIRNCNFLRTQSYEYFCNNYEREHGLAYLVSKSFYDNHKAPEVIKQDDLDMCFQISLLVKNLSVNGCNQLGSFLEMLLRRVEEMEAQWKREKDIMVQQILRSNYCIECRCAKCEGMKLISYRTYDRTELPIRIPPIPRNYAGIRSTIRDGKNSFLTLLPYPKIHRLNDDHVYVLPSECIKHFLGYGYTPLLFETLLTEYPVSNLCDTPRGVTIARNLERNKCTDPTNIPHLKISFLEWKDDCESAKSNKKSKYHMWLFTITIFTSGMESDSPIGTFPIAIGPKGKNHDRVERIIANDFKHMKTKAIPTIMGWSTAGSPRQCTFSAELYMSLGDQPERRGANGLMLGGSRTHARWLHACDYSQLSKVLPACDYCFQLMIDCDSLSSRENPSINKTQWLEYKCNTCSNWAKDLSDPMLHFDRSEKFPKHYVLGGEAGEGRLLPIVLSYEVLHKVCRLTFSKVSSGLWSKEEGMTYLNDNCINDHHAMALVQNALNCYRYNLIKDQRGEDDELFRQLSTIKLENPSKYRIPRFPSVHSRDIPLHLYVDTPMHLLFLGVCKNIFNKLSTWSSRRGRKGKFDILAKQQLQQLDELKIGWLVFMPSSFGMKWGGWVSKHYQSLVRVALWIYGPLMAIDDGPCYEDPKTDPTKWTVILLQNWLKARGLDASGIKSELQPRVMDYLHRDHVPPIKPNMYGSAEDMLEMLKSMVVLVTTLLHNQVELRTKDIIELRVRIFLSRFERFDKPMRNETRKPTYVSSYNYLSLLNLGETVAEFGPMRRYFEGKWLGERYVQTVKDERSRCGPNNVYYTLMRNLLRNKSMESLKSTQTLNDYNAYMGFNTKIYGSSDDIDTCYIARTPLPFVVVDRKTLGCIFYEKGRNIGLHIVIRILTQQQLPMEETHHQGLRYWLFLLSSHSQPVDWLQITDFGVLLPKLGNSEVGVYTVVTKNWSTMMYGDYDLHEESENYPSPVSRQEKNTQVKTEDGIRDAHWC
jgi:hypothetical protein